MQQLPSQTKACTCQHGLRGSQTRRWPLFGAAAPPPDGRALPGLASLPSTGTDGYWAGLEGRGQPSGGGTGSSQEVLVSCSTFGSEETLRICLLPFCSHRVAGDASQARRQITEPGGQPVLRGTHFNSTRLVQGTGCQAWGRQTGVRGLSTDTRHTPRVPPGATWRWALHTSPPHLIDTLAFRCCLSFRNLG